MVPTEFQLMMFLPVIAFLLSVGIAIYLIVLFTRLVKAVERIADKFEK